MISETQLNINQECVRRHLQFENAQDMEGTLSSLHPECVFEDMPLDKILPHARQAGGQSFAKEMVREHLELQNRFSDQASDDLPYR